MLAEVMAPLLALASAAAAGAAVVAQQRATHELGGAADRRLLRRPWWLAGTGASVVASALQAVALAQGAVVVVQALLATAVAWTTVGESLLARRLPGRGPLLGVGLAMLGPLLVVVLLGPVRAGGGGVDLTSTPVALSLLGVGVVVVAGLVGARQRPGAPGALGLALACGAGYGLAASLLAVLARDPAALLTDPQYSLVAVLLLVVGPAAFVASQRALARARRAGPVVTVILLADPLVATAIGATWFGERIALDALTTAGIVLAVGLSAIGVRALDVTSTPSHNRGLSRRLAIRPPRGCLVFGSTRGTQNQDVPATHATRHFARSVDERPRSRREPREELQLRTHPLNKERAPAADESDT